VGCVRSTGNTWFYWINEAIQPGLCVCWEKRRRRRRRGCSNEREWSVMDEKWLNKRVF